MKVIDLTMRIKPSMRVFPGSPKPSFISWSRFDIHGYNSELMFMSTHTGTHVDAPSHFASNMPSIDKIQAYRFVSNAVLVKMPKKANELIEQEDIPKRLELNRGDTIVFMTGWETHVRSNSYMSDNPGLSAGAAKYLVSKNVNAVAIDGPSIDAGFDSKFAAHNILLPAGVLAIENLCNVGQISKDRFTLVTSPLKLAGATGSPARVLALIS
jgi:kynurenine formamidase